YPCSPSDALGARGLHSFPTRRSSDLEAGRERGRTFDIIEKVEAGHAVQRCAAIAEEGVCFRTHIRILQVDDMCAFNGEELFPVRKVRIDERAEFGDDARTPRKANLGAR